jgi:ribulose-phosphate 3-epimerase
VPNLTIGPPVVKSLRKHTDHYLDCHLMVEDPEALLPALAEGGANGVSMHVEPLDDPGRALEAAAALGLDTGLAVKPGTPLDTVLPFLDRLDLVLTMTVEPGFGGQAFDDRVLPKIAAARRAIAAAGREVALQVDGGVNAATAPRCLEAGADVFVVGTGIFHADDPAAAAKAFRELISGGAG